jgi:hypothetical protein
MATIAALESCDGFAVEAADGLLGWVEETWLDGEGRPGALALRTRAGGRALLLAQDVQAVDPDTQEVVLRADAKLHELDAPRLESVDGTIAASWRTTGAAVEPAPAPLAAESEPAAPAVAAVRAATAHVERPLPYIVAFALCVLAAIVAFQIALAFLVAYLVTGRAY